MDASFDKIQLLMSLHAVLGDSLSSETIADLSGNLERVDPARWREVLTLTEDLVRDSTKATVEYLKVVAEVTPLLADLSLWVEMGQEIARRSAAAAVRYFQESPGILGKIPAEKARLSVLDVGVVLVEEDYGVALEYFRASPGVVRSISSGDLVRWADIGLELAGEDYGVAREYFRASASVLASIGIEHLPPWVAVARYLSRQSAKSDYMTSYVYFRESPDLLASLLTREERLMALRIGEAIARGSASIAIDFFQQLPGILNQCEAPADREKVLISAVELAKEGGETAWEFLKAVPKIIHLINPGSHEFSLWFEEGKRLLSRNQEQARAYFAFEVRISREVAGRLVRGVFLKDIARILTLYARGISGSPVGIRSTEELPEEIRTETAGASTSDGLSIYLPPQVKEFESAPDNFRLYKVMTLHEAGHFEFGTYEGESGEDDFFTSFPNPLLAKDLWHVVEDGRIESHLRRKYPGVRGDLDLLVRENLKGRPQFSSLSPTELVVEALLQLSIAGSTREEVPPDLAPLVAETYTLFKRVELPHSPRAESMSVTAEIYTLLEKRFAAEPLQFPQESLPSLGSLPSAVSIEYRPMKGLSYRGEMSSSFVRSTRETMRRKTGEWHEQLERLGVTLSQREVTALVEKAVAEGRVKGERGDLAISDRELLRLAGKADMVAGAFRLEALYLYDEWDREKGDYKTGWCTLREREQDRGSETFVEETSALYRDQIYLLRRFFGSLRPESRRRVKKQEGGEEIDLDAAIESLVERRARVSPSDRVYIRREKKERDVCAAFLIDMSGSTAQQVPGLGKRVIDVEKEGVVLLSEALEALGDEYAIYGFSGNGRDQVDFYMVKGFEEGYEMAVHQRIGAITPLGQNRDGAAVRHATHRLEGRRAKIKLLILLSDGKPLDQEYSGEYSVQDTQVALREAMMKGIHPYCITVDREGKGYLPRMYGEVKYTVIDDVRTLPEKLPRIYKRLTT